MTNDPTPYDLVYRIRVLFAFLILLLANSLLLSGTSLLVGFLYDRLNLESSPVAIVLAATLLLGWGFIGIYYLLCRLLASPASELRAIDVTLSRWATQQAGMRIRVYRTGWRRTYSYHSITSRHGRIHLGTETLTLGQLGLTFVLYHEIAHLTARGARWRRITTWLLYYMDSIRDLKSKRSMLLERKGPKVAANEQGVRAIFKEDLPLKTGFFWLPIRLACVVLEMLEIPISLIIGSCIRKEEFYADRVAANRMGRSASRALGEAARHFKAAENLSVYERGKALAMAYKAWYIGDLPCALAAFARGMRPKRFRQPVDTWYPCWKERYIRVFEMKLERPSKFAPSVPIDRAPFGDRVVISDCQITVRSFAYLYPPLILALPVYLSWCLLSSVLCAYSLFGNPFGDSGDALSCMSLFWALFTVGLILVVIYSFLAGETQFIIYKRSLLPAAPLAPSSDRTDAWLSLELPKSLRTRLVLSSITSPLILFFLLFNLRRLLSWLKKDAFALEVIRRLGKLNGMDRIGLMTAFRFDSDAELLLRNRNKRTEQSPPRGVKNPETTIRILQGQAAGFSSPAHSD